MILVGETALADQIRRSLAGSTDIRIVACDQPNVANVVITDTPPSHPAGTPFVLIGDHDELIDAIRSGAAGVVHWDVGSRELALTIEAVARGLAVMPAAILDEGLDMRAANGPHDEMGAHGQNRPILTPREAEVLALIAAGASNKLIARNLAISIHTAKFHVASILSKLDATGRADAIAQAARLGLLML